MCDDSKWAAEDRRDGLSGVSGKAVAPRAGKGSGITGMKVCPQLDRGQWCQSVPRGHDQDICHMVSQKRRTVLDTMRQLVDAHVNRPVCPEWDTSGTCENTPGPFRFGVYKATKNNDNYKIIGSQLTYAGCECMKRNGLQDDCRLPRCRGSPGCKEAPFPRCEPFLGTPQDQGRGQAVAGAEGVLTAADLYGGDHCRCPDPDRF